MAFMKFYVGNEANASSHRDGIYIAIDTKKIFYNGDAYGGGNVDLSNYYTIAQVNGKIGNNTYTGANYISKETNLTDAVLQLDTEIKATNDNLALEHTNAEATYAKKTELGNYLRKDITELTFGDSSNPLLGSYIIIREPRDGGTCFSISHNGDQLSMDGKGITIIGKGPSYLLNAGGGTVSIQDIISQVTVPTKVSELTNDSGFITKTTADGYYQPKGNYLTSVSWSQVSGKPTFAAVATSGSYNDLTNKPTIPNVSTANNSGTISLIIDSNTLSFRSDGIAFNGSMAVSFPVVEVLSTKEINQILNS